MARYGCMICGWIYDEELGDETVGIEPGTSFEELPDEFECPDCGCSKDQFDKAE